MLFRIPATGEAPLTFAARNLPAGLSLDARTGIISGAIAGEGRTDVEITVSNAHGTATRTLTVVGGDDAIALTPPVGWNSWNVWGRSVDEAPSGPAGWPPLALQRAADAEDVARRSARGRQVRLGDASDTERRFDQAMNAIDSSRWPRAVHSGCAVRGTAPAQAATRAS